MSFFISLARGIWLFLFFGGAGGRLAGIVRRECVNIPFCEEIWLLINYF